MALHMIVPSITGIDVAVNSFGEVELLLKEGDRLIPARVVSEGTLRILGLLSLVGAKEPPALLAFEEPENGIHPRRIRLIADFLRERTFDTQVVVTTHSPILPDLIADQFLYACSKRSGQTRIEPFTSLSLWRERNISNALDSEEEPLLISEHILRGDFDD